ISNSTPSVVDMVYSLNLANIVPPASSFSVLVNSNPRTVNSVAVSGSKVSLTLASPVVYGDVVFVSYTVPASNQLQTVSGAKAVSISNKSVTNNVLAVSPVYVSSSVENATPSLLTMVYSLSLANTVPDKSAFIVKVNSVVRTLTQVSISGTKVLLTLNSPVIYSDVITVSYTKPSVNPLQTLEGGLAANISNKSVTNNVLPPSPVYVSSVIENATPSILRMTYSLTLKNVVPATTAFTVMVNSVKRNVNPVAISGTNVLLTLASPVSAGDVVTVAYTKPSSNPLQTSAGGLAATISAQPVTNNVGVSNNLPVIVTNYNPNAKSGIVNTIDASGSYDIDKDNLTFSWVAPDNIPVSSTSASVIQFLAPVVSSPRSVNFVLNLSDGKGVQSLTIPVQILPFSSGLSEATFSRAVALSYLAPDKPENIIDNNLSTKWSGSGDGNWVVLKLKKPFKIEYIQIAYPDSQQGSSIFDVSASVDSLSWDNNIMSTVTSCSFSGNYQIFEFPDIYKSIDYSYLKITGHGNTVDKWNYISELKLFGYPYGGSQDQGMFTFTVYPNPAKDYIVLSFNDQTPTDLSLFIISQTGEIIRRILIPEGTYLTQPIDLLNLQPGFYILQLQAGNTIVGAKKIVVAR
ncbi:MAG TPA: SwmB domain-containing protein, partial [Bacteroidales bacterium]|nr:SwmB domain-containing protein [Bacteroidales bacterium]